LYFVASTRAEGSCGRSAQERATAVCHTGHEHQRQRLFSFEPPELMDHSAKSGLLEKFQVASEVQPHALL